MSRLTELLTNVVIHCLKKLWFQVSTNKTKVTMLNRYQETFITNANVRLGGSIS